MAREDLTEAKGAYWRLGVLQLRSVAVLHHVKQEMALSPRWKRYKIVFPYVVFNFIKEERD